MNNVDFEYLSYELNTAGLFGSDSALANMFLLQKKYNTDIKINENILYRYYYGNENRTGYAFPIPLKAYNEGSDSADGTFGYLKKAIKFILEDAKKQNRESAFCLMTQEQKNIIDACLSKNFPSHQVQWKTNRDDCDYIYLQKNLSDLPGSNYQKKRNHISRFNRTYGDDWAFKSFPENDLKDDILTIAAGWFIEKNGNDNHALELEKESVSLALENAKMLGLKGGVLYIHGKPAAMTLAAPISPDVIDVIYEKALNEFEKDGAYTVINQQFSKKCGDYLYINREEDMGVEGLRKAKLSYKPAIILDKFYGKIL